MKKRLVLLLALIVGLLALAVPTVVFAHQQGLSTTVFYACEAETTTGNIKAGDIDPNSITQDDTLNCSLDTSYTVPVKWSVTGPQGDIGPIGPKGDTGPQGLKGDTGDTGPTGLQGDPGLQGSPGPQGDTGAQGLQGDPGPKGDKGDTGDTGATGPKGDTGPAGIPFSHVACTEILTGSAQQENRIFCQSGIEADGGLVYTAAINAAKVHILVGTPIAAFPSVDWGNLAITYVEFSSGFHVEYHADNVVRIYNTLNQRVF